MSADRRIIAGAVILLVCGAMIIASTFMPWMGFTENGHSEYGSAWEIINIIRDDGGNLFLDTGFGKPIFTGIIFVIIGALIILVSLILFFRHEQMVATTLLFLSLIAALISTANIYSISTTDIPSSEIGLLIGIGLYISLAFSILGVVGYLISFSGIRGRIIEAREL